MELEARQAQMQQRIAVEQQVKKELAECTFKPKVRDFFYFAACLSAIVMLVADVLGPIIPQGHDTIKAKSRLE